MVNVMASGQFGIFPELIQKIEKVGVNNEQ